ncbi:MAG: hypothetical protein HYR51_05630 [Candidatus Rokubacteria bacterium]|nr:hypothetical protein [Candidatus Rokubacteria bacterium]
MPPASLARRLLVLAAVALWLGGFVASAAAAPHSHYDGGIYNEDCPLVSLATLGGSVVLADRDDGFAAPIVTPAVLPAAGDAPDAPRPVATSRAPPLA